MYGLGDPLAHFKVYIANRPQFKNLPHTDVVHPVTQGEIYAIGQACGNGWRKVFNVYAKLVFALNSPKFMDVTKYKCWQDYRDQCLLQQNSNTALLFSPPILNQSQAQDIHIIMGKTYANSLSLFQPINQLDNDFAIDVDQNLIVCPYFDYRQLSNLKIIRLVELITKLKAYNSKQG
ncbi:hypothetical protein L0668_12695 [Paraglaciecola aquimarina]|uniref:Uncharacterized protein n=1 Tax=Paraglaciecola algarum TaxID=3050085 RepID=A0ABS9D7M5_9ALTE|nr:hypothetical protein [Paraglaciecola sp. G1-23]